jgi:hypothetical protein
MAGYEVGMPKPDGDDDVVVDDTASLDEDDRTDEKTDAELTGSVGPQEVDKPTGALVDRFEP